MWAPISDVQVGQLNALPATQEVSIQTHVDSHIGVSSGAAQRACNDSGTVDADACGFLYQILKLTSSTRL